MGGKRGAVEIAPAVRGAVMRSLKIVEGSKKQKQFAGMSLSEIFAEMIMDGQVKEVIDMASKFTPKEMLIDVQGGLTINTNEIPLDLMKEVFDGQGIDEGSPPAIQSVDTVEATERPTMVSFSQPS